jgi:3-hydroxy-3-methylglutaryl CoA synthase
VHQNFDCIVPVASTVIDDSLLRSAERELFEVELSRAAAEVAFNDAFAALEAHDAFRKRLVVAQDRARTRRAHLLEERAYLLKILGRVK